MRIQKRILAVALVTMVAITSATPGFTQEQPAEEQQGIESVLIRLKQDKDAFEKFMSGTLSPQLKKISDSFASNVGKAEALLERIKRDPKNKRLKAEYEDVLSEAITQAASFLKGFAELKDPSFEALDGVKDTIVDGKKEFGKLAKENQKLVDEYKKQSSDARKHLQELAEKYRRELSQGLPLPPEVDEDVRLLQVDIDMAVANDKILAMTVTDATNAIAELDEQLSDLSELRVDLNVAFRQAAGQQTLLGNVARFKKQRIQMAAMFGRLNAVRKQVAAHKVNVGKIGRLVTQIVENDLNATKTVADKKTDRIQQSSNILKSYLEKPQAPKNRVATAKKQPSSQPTTRRTK